MDDEYEKNNLIIFMVKKTHLIQLPEKKYQSI